MELLTISLFCIILLVCIVLDFSILYALIIGLFLFILYSLKKGFSLKETIHMCIDGIKTAKNILLTFILIGMLTAFWRASGTIPVIVCYASKLIQPSIFLLAVFLLNCFVSFLTGTSFGTSATIGVICATMAETMGLSPALVGGAVLSGAFFGDRCSPVSTSALLVSELTETTIFDNIRLMLKTAVVPFLITCALYGIIGLFASVSEISIDLNQTMAPAFHLHWIALLPALIILILSALRVPVKKAMLCSILSALPICILLQDMNLQELLLCAIKGYQTKDATVATMMNGGGILSMVRVGSIVCLSSSYSGIFKKTGILDGIQNRIEKISERITAFGAMLLTSLVTSAIACNQTLGIMLTKQLCEKTEPNKTTFAIHLENTVVLVSALIPWCIAGAVPLATVKAPSYSVIYSFFLYILPLWCLLVEIISNLHNKKRGKRS